MPCKYKSATASHSGTRFNFRVLKSLSLSQASNDMLRSGPHYPRSHMKSLSFSERNFALTRSSQIPACSNC